MTSFKTRKSDKQVFPVRNKVARDSGNPQFVGVDKSQVQTDIIFKDKKYSDIKDVPLIKLREYVEGKTNFIPYKNFRPLTKKEAFDEIERRANNDYAIEKDINKILYNPNKSQKHKEVLTIEIPQNKQEHFKFLKAYTKFNTVGVWKKTKDNNVQIEVEFYDSKDEKYGKKLMGLIKELNKEKIGEQVIYARTEPVEESTLRK